MTISRRLRSDKRKEKLAFFLKVLPEIIESIAIASLASATLILAYVIFTSLIIN